MTFLKRQIRRNLILLSGAAVSEQAAYPSVPYGRGDSAVGGPPWRGDRDSGWRIEQASLKAGANGKDKDVSGGELRSSIVVLVLEVFRQMWGKSVNLRPTTDWIRRPPPGLGGDTRHRGPAGWERKRDGEFVTSGTTPFATYMYMI